jgi:hypothetical protein
VDGAARIADCGEVRAHLVAAATAGQPLTYSELLAALGQGWWVAGGAEAHGYDGQWDGPGAARFIARLQAKTFAYWAMAKSGASG